MNVLQVAVLGVLGVLFAIQLKGGKSEYGMYIGVGISILIFSSIVNQLRIIVQTVQEISGFVKIEASFMTTLIKILGITYISEFASGICKDAGYQNIASQIEVFSKLTILVLSLPVLLALLKTIQDFLS